MLSGSPGERWRMRNRTMLIPIRIGTAISRRRATYRPIAPPSAARSSGHGPIFDVPGEIRPGVEDETVDLVGLGVDREPVEEEDVRLVAVEQLGHFLVGVL